MSKKTFEQILDETGTLCYTNKGVSMMPLLRQDKDVMIIEKSPDGKYNKYDAVLYTRFRNNSCKDYVLHRILRINEDGTYWIVGDNCFTGETVEKENILGVMTGVVRNGKQVNTASLKYKLYMFLWCRCYPARIAVLRLKNAALNTARRIRNIIVRKGNCNR